MTFLIKENVLQRAAESSDSWENIVLSLLEICNDLVAEVALYLAPCTSMKKEDINYRKSVRPVNNEKPYAYDKVCDWLEKNSCFELGCTHWTSC